MCTLIVARNVFPSFPTVIAANRDEYLDRPASPPKIWDGETRILAPVDERRGGTWIGASDRGVIAAITNRHDVTSVPGRHSRGSLVLAALGADNATMATVVLGSLSGRNFNGFHLVVLDRTDAYLLKGDGVKIVITPLDPGVHVITQFGTAPDHGARAVSVGRRYRHAVAHREPIPPVLDALLTAHHDDAPLDGSCIHMPKKGYGTRCSTVIRMGDDAAGLDYWHREGHACAGPFGEMTRFDFRR